jgi:hypothetical protein
MYLGAHKIPLYVRTFRLTYMKSNTILIQILAIIARIGREKNLQLDLCFIAHKLIRVNICRRKGRAERNATKFKWIPSNVTDGSI